MRPSPLIASLCALLAPLAAAGAPLPLRAIRRAPQFLVQDNPAERFRLDGGVEVDPGSVAHAGVDARGRPIWVVDQKVRFSLAPADLGATFLDGFFTGRAAGPTGRDLHARLIAEQRAGQWRAAPPEATLGPALRRSPFADPTLERFVIRVDNVRPLPGPPGLVRAGAMDLLVEQRSVVRSADHAEFTVHFLNPDERQGPFPGLTDGAVRFRALRNPDGSATVEGYYVTAAAREYVDGLTDYSPLLSLGKRGLRFGRALWEATPPGRLAAPLTRLTLRTLESATDAAIDASGGVRRAVALLHARYYRTVLFPNLVQPR